MSTLFFSIAVEPIAELIIKELSSKVIVTSATAIIYGNTEWDIVKLAGKFDSKIMVSFAMIGILISTLATNIAANIVSPANDFANLAPDKINFKTNRI